MTLENLNDLELSDCTLRALLNSLKLHGHDLDQIFDEYDNKILGNQLSGAAPQHKLATVEHLKKLINEAKSNEELN